MTCVLLLYRGGVPVCFPQFGMMGPMSSQHGFVRNVAFIVEEASTSKVTMMLDYDGKSQATYPHPFQLRVSVALSGDSLVQDVRVRNIGGDWFAGLLAFWA